MERKERVKWTITTNDSARKIARFLLWFDRCHWTWRAYFAHFKYCIIRLTETVPICQVEKKKTSVRSPGNMTDNVSIIYNE